MPSNNLAKGFVYWSSSSLEMAVGDGDGDDECDY